MTNPSSNDLIRAVEEGDVDKASSLIATFGLSHSEAWSGGYTLLCEALKRKHTKIAKVLLKHGSRVNGSTERKTDTPLHFAVKNQDAEMVAMLLDREADVDATNHSGETPLHLSVVENNLNIVSLLLNKNPNLEVENNLGRTPLRHAIFATFEYNIKDNVVVVGLLCRKNARTPTRSVELMDDLHIAAGLGRTKVVEHLLNSGTFVDIVSEVYGFTPLLHACAMGSGKEETIKLLLERGANINARNRNQSTALHVAAEKNSDKIVKILLEHNDIDINAEDDSGRTALNVAIEQSTNIFSAGCSYLRTIKNILEFCSQVDNEKNRHCIRDSLHGHRCSSEIVEALLSHGFRVHPEDASDLELLHTAVDRGFTKIVEDLLQYGAVVESPCVKKRGFTLLHNAAFNRHLDIAEMLIKHGADVKAIDEIGKTPISYAIRRIDAKMTKLLVSRGATPEFDPSVFNCFYVNSDAKEIIEMMLNDEVDYDIRAKNACAQTALWRVVASALPLSAEPSEECCRIQRDLIELLLSRGAKVDVKNEREESLLYKVVGIGRDDILEILLRYNADVNCASRCIIYDVQTSLHLAASRGNERISRMLLNAGAASNVKKATGETPLHYACEHEWNRKYNDKIVDTLLEFGAEIDNKDSRGSTPLHRAARWGCSKTVEVLLKSLADTECTDKDGKTALHVASESECPKIVGELLDYDADPNVTSKKGQSPIDYVTAWLRHYNENQAEQDSDDQDDYHDFFDDNSSKRRNAPKTAETIKQHIIKMKSLNIHGIKQNFESIELNDELKHFQAECEREVGLMKSERIGDTNISYYDVLMKSLNQLAMLVRNKDAVEVLESARYREKFPIYGKMLYYKFKKSQKRENLLNRGLQSLNFLSTFPLPEVVSLKLLDNLSNKDMENLIKAVPKSESK